ncbi:hypothetical protein U9M48_011524, partial [Paspalum notatum var. saurae]
VRHWRLVLVRHGESEGTWTRPPTRASRTPGSASPAAKGWRDADACGRRLRNLFSSSGFDDWKVYFYVSPYRRTLETLRGSAANVYDRISGFRETLRADIDLGRFQPPSRGDMNVVFVSHGLTLRARLPHAMRLGNLVHGSVLVMQAGHGGRYSLLVHHTADELREFGSTDEMLQDQMWQKMAKPGDLNYSFVTNGQSFFDPFTPLPTS